MTGTSATVPTFDDVSRVAPLDDRTARAEISPDWTVAGRPNGGYLLSLMARAAPRPEHLPDVVAASAHYLRPPEPGPVEIRGEPLRTGRTVGHVRVALVQDDATLVEALLTLGHLDEDSAPAWDGGHTAPVDTRPEDGARISPDPAVFPVPLFDQVDARLDADSAGVLAGRPTGRGELRGWLALPGDEPFTPASLLFAVDAFPPATLDIREVGWVPTLQLSAYVRAHPAPGPVRILQRAQVVDGGRLDETCLVWDSRGRLVAQATQLAVVAF